MNVIHKELITDKISNQFYLVQIFPGESLGYHRNLFASSFLFRYYYYLTLMDGTSHVTEMGQ